MQEILDEIQEMKKALQQLEQRVNLSSQDKLITYLFDKVFDLEEIEVKIEDIKENNSLYIIEKTPQKIILKRVR